MRGRMHGAVAAPCAAAIPEPLQPAEPALEDSGGSQPQHVRQPQSGGSRPSDRLASHTTSASQVQEHTAFVGQVDLAGDINAAQTTRYKFELIDSDADKFVIDSVRDGNIVTGTGFVRRKVC